MRIKWKDDYSAETQRWFGIAIGVAVGLWVGFVLGWAWSGRSGSLANVRALDLVSVVGTLGAAIGAVYAARVALKVANDDRQLRHEQARAEAIDYVVSKFSVFFDAGMAFTDVDAMRDGDRIILQNPEKLDQAIELLESLDFHRLRMVHVDFRRLTIGALAGMRRVKGFQRNPSWDRKKKIAPLFQLITWSCKNLHEAAFALHAGEKNWERHLGEGRPDEGQPA